jgi:hypothetical protein
MYLITLEYTVVMIMMPVAVMTDSGLSCLCKVTYGVLIGASKRGVARITQRELAARIGTHQPTACKAIQALWRAGYVVKLGDGAYRLLAGGYVSRKRVKVLEGAEEVFG